MSHSRDLSRLGRTGIPAVATAAALRDLVEFSSDPPEAVQTLGVVAAGDGSGGLWRWDATSLADDNLGTVLSPTGRLTAGRWLREYGDTVNAAWFGPDNTGSVDVTALLQAAIDTDAPIVYVPPGIYLTTEISIGEGQTLAGAGMYGGTIFRVPPGFVDYSAVVGNIGLSAKTGINRCAFRDFEYDGNTAYNRGWGSGSSSWEDDEYGLVSAAGITLGRYGGRVPPQYAAINNVYIHDVTRNGIAIAADDGDQITVVADNVHVANSDADHLIYEAQNAINNVWSNVLLEGHARGAMIVTQEGNSYSNITIQKIVANPTTYDTFRLINIRAQDGANVCGRSVNISNLQVKDFDCSAVAGDEGSCAVFSMIGGLNLSNASLNVLDPEYASRFYFLQYNVAGHQSLGNTTVSGVKADNVPGAFHLVGIAATVDAGEVVKSVHVDKAIVRYGNASPITSAAGTLFSVIGDTRHLSARSIRVYGLGARCLYRDQTGVISNVDFENIYVEFCPDFLIGASVGENLKFRHVVCDSTVAFALTSGQYDRIYMSDVTCGARTYTFSSNLTTSGTGSDRIFEFPHSQEVAPKFWQVTPASPDTGTIPFYVLMDGTNIRIIHESNLPAGTNNLTWQALYSSTPLGYTAT